MITLLFIVWFAINSSKVSPISQNTPISPTPAAFFAKVTRVVDGTQLKLKEGKKLDILESIRQKFTPLQGVILRKQKRIMKIWFSVKRFD